MANFNAHKLYFRAVMWALQTELLLQFHLRGAFRGDGRGGFFEEAVTLQYHHLWHEPTPILHELQVPGHSVEQRLLDLWVHFKMGMKLFCSFPECALLQTNSKVAMTLF